MELMSAQVMSYYTTPISVSLPLLLELLMNGKLNLPFGHLEFSGEQTRKELQKKRKHQATVYSHSVEMFSQELGDNQSVWYQLLYEASQWNSWIQGNVIRKSSEPLFFVIHRDHWTITIHARNALGPHMKHPNTKAEYPNQPDLLPDLVSPPQMSLSSSSSGTTPEEAKLTKPSHHSETLNRSSLLPQPVWKSSPYIKHHPRDW